MTNKSAGKKKSLVGWTRKDWTFSPDMYGEITHSCIYKNKNDNGEQENTKVRITIEEL